MFGLRKIWLAAISSVAGRIWRVKQALGQSQSQLKTVFSCFWILALELALAILSLPVYLTRDYTKDPILFNHDCMAYSTYCRRKKVTLIAAILAVVLTIGYLYLPGQPVKAAVVTWDNGGGDGVWGTCTNWSGDACPGTSDIATFDGTSTANASINAAISVAGIDINSGYTGTITQAAAITVGSSHFDQAAGTFVGGGPNDDMDIDGNFTQTAGTFTETDGYTYISGNFTQSGGTWNAHGGTIEFDGGSTATLNLNVSLTVASTTVNKSGSAVVNLSSNDTLVTTGTLYLKDGAFYDLETSSVWEAQGNIYQYVAFDGGANNINITGTANQIFYGDATPTGGDLPPITINKTGGTLTFGTGVSTTMRIDAANFT